MNLVEEKLRLAEMSVNKVAETLQNRGEGVQLKASEMLRQQQEEIDRLLTIAEDFQMLIVKQKAEIESLKMDIHSLTYGERLAEYLRKAKG